MIRVCCALPVRWFYKLANDRTVKLWKISELSDEVNPEFEYKVHLYGINQAKWNIDGNMLATTGNDCSVNVMDINKVFINYWYI